MWVRVAVLPGRRLGGLSLLPDLGGTAELRRRRSLSGAGKAEQWVLCCLLGPCQGIQLCQKSSYGEWAPGPRSCVKVWAESAPVSTSSHWDK